MQKLDIHRHRDVPLTNIEVYDYKVEFGVANGTRRAVDVTIISDRDARAFKAYTRELFWRETGDPENGPDLTVDYGPIHGYDEMGEWADAAAEVLLGHVIDAFLRNGADEEYGAQQDAAREEADRRAAQAALDAATAGNTRVYCAICGAVLGRPAKGTYIAIADGYCCNACWLAGPKAAARAKARK
jgi:hypothetical protein